MKHHVSNGGKTKMDNQHSELQAWTETSNALEKLECLLKCSICTKTLNDPHTLSGCYDHFCRSCILDTLSVNSVCPNCNLPAWVKDLRTNRQLDNVVRHMATLKDLVTQRSDLTSTTKNQPNVDGDEIIVRCTATEETPSLTTMGQIDAAPAISTAPTFKVPRIEEQLIKRRLKKTHMKPDGYVSGQTLNQNSKPGAPVKNHLPQQTLYFKTPGMTDMSTDVEGMGGVHSSNNESNSRSLKQDPTKSVPQSNLLISVSRKNEMKIVQQNTDSSTYESFGKPKAKRRSVSREQPSSISKLSLEFPFTPLVTKTRQYAKLDHAGKLKRLQGSSSTKNMERKSMKVEGQGDRCMHQPVKRMHQLNMEAFMKEPTKIQDGVPESPHAGNSLSVLPSENPVPPSTPSTAQVRTMRRNIRGETPLHLAAIKGDLNVVRLLLQQGADPNVKDHAGWTPLHEACNHGHLEVSVALLDAGALLNIPGFENDTPLHDAVANGHTDIATLLLSRGANPDLRNRHGITAEQLAVTEAMKNVFHHHHHQSYPSPKLHISPNAIRVPHASPILNGGPSQVVLLGTGLKGYQKNQLHEVASLLGAEVVDSFSAEVSHLVTVCDKSRCCPRTLKFLCAVTLGKWIVDFQWITKCFQERCWVDETQFEVQGVTVGESTLITQAPRNGRENMIQKLPGLFDGCEIFLSGKFSPPRASKEDLSYLIKLSGGKILNREPRPNEETTTTVWPCHSTENNRMNTYIVYDPYTDTSKSIVTKSSTSNNVAIVPASWLLDCITHFQLLKADLDTT